MGTKGNRNRKAQKNRQQKALLKRRKRKATVRAQNIQRNAPKSRKAASVDPMAAVLNAFENSGQATWWVANGLNYLASDYDEGIWSPVFPEIYDDDFEITVELIKDYLNQHFNAEDNTWTTEGRRAIGIVMSPVQAVYTLAQKCISEARAAEVDPTTPKCEPVWKVFNIMKQEMDSQLADKYLDQSEVAENQEEPSDNNEAIQS